MHYDLKKAWLMVMAIFITGIGMAWSQNKVIPIIGNIMTAYGVDNATAGWLSSIFCFTSIIMALPATSIIRKYGLKKSGAVAIICSTVGSLLGLIAGSFFFLLISRIIEGIGVGIITVLAPSVITMWFPNEKRGLPMGVWGSWQMVAQGGNFFLAKWLTDLFGWHGMWYFGIVLSAVSLILYVAIVHAPDEKQNYAPIENEDISLNSGLHQLGPWIMALIGLLFSFAYFGWVTWIGQYWESELGVSESAANVYLGYMCIIEIPVVMIVGVILDHKNSKKLIAVLSATGYIILLFIGYRMTSPSQILPFIIAYPIIEGGIPTFLWTATPETVRRAEDSGTALALLSIGINAGAVIGPPVIGKIIEQAGWHAATVPLCLSILISAVCMVKVRLYSQQE